MKGSKFGREQDSRAARSVRLLRDISALRLISGMRGVREPGLDILEPRLRELDEIHGYDRARWNARNSGHGNVPRQSPEFLDWKSKAFREGYAAAGPAPRRNRRV